MRDALTLLDQIVAFGGNRLEGKEVASLLGIAERETLHAVAEAILKGLAADVLTSVHELGARGLDMLHFAKQLLGYFRQLVVLDVVGGEADELLSLGPEEKALALALASSTNALELQRAFSALSILVEDVARASSPQTVLEMGLVRLATRPPLEAVSEVLARLEALERRLAPGPSSGSPSPAPGRGSRSTPDRPASKTTSSAPARAHDGRNARLDTSALKRPSPEKSAPEKPARNTAELTPTSNNPAPPDAVSAWQQIVLRLRETRPALAAVLEHGAPLRVDRECITVGFPPGSFFGQQAATGESKEGLADGASQIIGAKPRIEVKFTADAELPAPTVAGLEEKKRDDVREERRKAALEHPTVQAAREVFPEGAQALRVLVDSD